MSLQVLDHPVAKDALSRLRDKSTLPVDFRREICRLSSLLAFEATRYLTTIETMVSTPLSISKAEIIAKRHAIVPIMRAGDGMLETFRILLPNALIWHMYVSRDEETFQPHCHGSKVPKHVPPDLGTCFLLDPMLATGGSASFAISHLKNAGAKHIVLVGVVGAPEGAAKLERDHPDVSIFLGAMDSCLNEKAYIVPGLGDAGDRQYPVE